MEAVEELPAILHTAEAVKSNTVEETGGEVAVAADVCHKSNGVADIEEAGQPQAFASDNDKEHITQIDIAQDVIAEDMSPESCNNLTEISEPVETCEFDITAPHNDNDKTDISNIEPHTYIEEQSMNISGVSEAITEVIIDATEKSEGHNSEIEQVIEESVEILETPEFKTEIVVEANVNTEHEVINDNISNNATEHDSNNILSELGENIELSEVLRSSDVTDTSENKKSPVRQEVFNKEELLDILEGNDVEQTTVTTSIIEAVEQITVVATKEIEAKLAMQQISRLKNSKRKPRIIEKISKVKKEKKIHCTSANVTERVIKSETDNNTIKKKVDQAHTDVIVGNNPKESIINELVMDWEDEEQEANESDQSKKTLAEAPRLQNDTEQHKQTPDVALNQEKPSVRSSVDSITSEDQSHKGKPSDENQPQRRLGRVIKKKVIFDPDNPDTFTKTKIKNKELIREHMGKEQSLNKKGKHDQTPQRSKSKSPMTKLQWKKPSLKNSKQNKRLTEVDKLLMDEGAVNMIYQLTPEAPKGKKSRATKAEFIKKIQSSTPDGKEMKFRERKKECMRGEEGEARKILGGKHRASLNSSMKSPSVSEDFETHSADDSIIYRRHSSSSYSSSCLSPRRLSDVDLVTVQSATRTPQQTSDAQNQTISSVGNTDQAADVFMSDLSNKSSSDIINKDDYLSIKEKLNTKLTMALNKRKRDSTKYDKPPKQKKITKPDEKSETFVKAPSEEFKYISISFDHKLAKICINKIDSLCGVEILKEIQQALNLVDTKSDISVTLLAFQCDLLCSNIDLKCVIEEDQVKRANNAYEVAESVRLVMVAVEKHSKLVCCGVSGACSGVWLALAALGDVVLASERASFALGPRAAPLQPGAAALTARCKLPHHLANDLILFGRCLSASEALQAGLVTRILWPDRFSEQIQSIAKDIASESKSSVIVKKRLINLKKNDENEQTFLSCLETERDVLVEYWTSVEGQEILRAAHNVT